MWHLFYTVSAANASKLEKGLDILNHREIVQDKILPAVSIFEQGEGH